MNRYIGLDVSMKRTFICVIKEHGKIIREGSENTDPHLIADYLEKLGLEAMTVGFESGSFTPYLLTHVTHAPRKTRGPAKELLSILRA